MTENPSTPFEANNDGVGDEIPLGNRTPLLVPPAIGQGFLQPKFIYPLGAVSLLNPDNLDLAYDAEPLSNSFIDSPFFDTPIQSPSLTTSTANQSVQRAIDTPSLNSRQTQPVLDSNQQIQRQIDRLSSSDNSTITPEQLQNVESSQNTVESQDIVTVHRELDIAPIDTTDRITSVDVVNNIPDIANNDFPEIQRKSDESTSESQSNETSMKISSEILQEPILSLNQSNSQNSQDIQRKIESSASVPISTQNQTNPVNQSSIEKTISSLPTNQIQLSTDNSSSIPTRELNIISTDNSTISGNDNLLSLSNPDNIQTSSVENIQRQVDSSKSDNILQGDDIAQIQAQQDLDHNDSSLVRDNVPQIPISSDLSEADIANNISTQIQRFPELSDIDSNLDINTNQQIQRQSDSSITKDIPAIVNFQAQNNNTSDLSKIESIQRSADIKNIDSNISVTNEITNIRKINDQQIQALPELDFFVDNKLDNDIQRSQDSPNLSDSSISSSNSNIEQIQRNVEVSAINTSNFTDSNQSIQRQSQLYANNDISSHTELHHDQISNESSSIENKDIIEPNIQSQVEIQRQSEEINLPFTNVNNNDSNTDSISETISPQIQKYPHIDISNPENLGGENNNEEAKTSFDLSNFSIDANNNTEQIQRDTELPNVNGIENNHLQVQRRSDKSSTSDYFAIDKPQQSQDIKQDIDQAVTKELFRSNIDSNVEQSNETQVLQRQVENDVIQASISSDLTNFNSVSSSSEQIQRPSNLSNIDVDNVRDGNQQIQRQANPSILSDNSMVMPPQSQSIELSQDTTESQNISAIQREIDIVPINSIDVTASRDTANNITDNDSPEIQKISDESTSESQINETSMKISNEIRQEPILEQISSSIDKISQNQSNSQNTQDIQRKIDPSVPILAQNQLNQTNQSSIDQTISSLPTNSPQQIQASAGDINDDINIDNSVVSKNNDDLLNLSDPNNISTSSVENIQRQVDFVESNNTLPSDEILQTQAQQDLDNRDGLFARDNVLQTPSYSDLSVDSVRYNNQQIQRQTDSSNLSDNSTITPEQSRNVESSQDTIELQDIAIVQREMDIVPIDTTEESSVSAPKLTQSQSNQVNSSNIDQTISSLPNNNQQIQASAADINSDINVSTDVIPIDNPAVSENDNLLNLSNPDNIQTSLVENIQRQVDLPKSDNILQSDNIPQIQAQQDLDNSDSSFARDNVPQMPISSGLSEINIINNRIEQIQRSAELPDIDSNLDIDINQQIQRQSDSSSVTNEITNIRKINDQQIQSLPDLGFSVNSESGNDIQQSQDSSNLSNSSILASNNNIEQIQRDVEISAIDTSNFVDGNQSIQRQPEEVDLSNSSLDESVNSNDDQNVQIESNSEVLVNKLSLDNNIQRQIDVPPLGVTTSDSQLNQPPAEQISLPIDDISQDLPNIQDIQRNIDPLESAIFAQSSPSSISQSDNDTSNSRDISCGDNILIAENADLLNVSDADITPTSSVESIQRQVNLSKPENILQSNDVPQIQQQNDLLQPNGDLVTNNVPEIQRMSENTQVAAQKIEQSSKVPLVQRFQDFARSAIGNIFADRSPKEQQTGAPVDDPVNPQIQRFDIQNKNTDVDIATDIESTIPDQVLQKQSINDDLPPANASNRGSVLDNQDVQMQGQPENLTINPEMITESAATISDTVQRQADIVNEPNTDANNSDQTKQESSNHNFERQDSISSSNLELSINTVSEKVQREPITLDNIPAPSELSANKQETNNSMLADAQELNLEQEYPQISSQMIQRFSEVNDASQSQNDPPITVDRKEITTSSQDYQNSKYLENSSQTVSPIQREADFSIENISEINQIDSLQRASQFTSVDDISQMQNESQTQSNDGLSIVENLNNNNLNSNVDIGIETINQPPTVQRKEDSINLTAINIDNVNSSIDQIEKSESTVTKTTPNISTPDNVQSAQNVIQRSPQSSNEIEASSELDLGIGENPKIIQMMNDPDRKTEDLQLPTAITNLAQTAYLGNFSPLTPSVPPQTIMRSQTDRPILKNPTSSITNRIQAKSDPSPSKESNDAENNSMGWSNISELLANLPPPTSNKTTSSLNQQTNRDRSSLASQPEISSANSSNQTTVQRSTDKSSSSIAVSDQELYLTPSGLQKGNPNRANNLSNVIQPARDYSQNHDLPQATVTVQRTQQEQGDQDEVNFDQNLEILAQEIYILLKKRLEIDKERQGGRYQGRLPW